MLILDLKNIFLCNINHGNDSGGVLPLYYKLGLYILVPEVVKMYLVTRNN